MNLVVLSDIIPYITSLLESDYSKVILPALRALGSIVSGTDEQTQIVLDAGFLGPLQTLLQHRKENIVREAMWGLSNVTAGNANQVEMVIRANLIPLIINVMKTRTFKTQKEAAWALCNMTASGNPEQMMFLVQLGAIPAMCDLLDCKETQIVMVLLDGIQNILKVVGNRIDVRALIEECKG